MKDILLSICVPTYNQPQELENLLNSLAPQATSEIEVIICDSSSNKRTKEAVNKYINKFNINYFWQEKSGIDKALISAVTKCRGKYVWTFGDDWLDGGAISKILDLVKKNPDIDFTWVNSRVFNENKPAMDLGGDKFFKDNNDVLDKLGAQISFISATIFNKENGLSKMEFVGQHIGSLFIHSYMVLSALSFNRRFYFISRPYVLSQRKSPDQPLSVNPSFDVFQVFAENFFRVVRDENFSDKFDKKIVRKMLSRHFRSLWRGVFVARAQGYNTGLGSHSPKIIIAIRYYWNFLEFWVALPFLVMPRFLDRWLYRIYVFLKRRNA